MIKKRKRFIIGIIISLIVILILLNIYSPKKEGFSTNTVFLKLNLPLGGEFVKNIKITNQESVEQTFNLYLNNFKDLVTIKNKEFSLGARGFREVEISFKDNRKEIGTYPGKLIIETQMLKREIPILLNIEDENRIFIISQTGIPKYTNVYPGGKLGMEIKIFNLQAYSSYKVKVKYSIKNLDDELILSEEEELVIKESFGTAKIIDIPKDTPLGNYVFITSIGYNNTKSTAGHLFSISKKEGGIFTELTFFVIIILVFVGGILVLFIYFIKTRDDLLIRLKRQQSNELKRSLKVMENYKTGVKELKDLGEKKKKVRELRKAKKKIVKKIKAKQRRQSKELKKLRKKGKKSEVEKTIEKWRKEGYKMFEVEKEMKKISKSDIGKQIKDWRRKGYKIGPLEDKTGKYKK